MRYNLNIPFLTLDTAFANTQMPPNQDFYMQNSAPVASIQPRMSMLNSSSPMHHDDITIPNITSSPQWEQAVPGYPEPRIRSLSNGPEYSQGPYRNMSMQNTAIEDAAGSKRRKTSTMDNTTSTNSASTKRARSANAGVKGKGADARNKSESTEPNNDDGDDNGDESEERRRKFLERNRLAASKCRQKKKIWIKELERRAEDATMQNRTLHLAVAQLKEEVVILKNQLLSHRNCGCGAIQQYLQAGCNSNSMSQVAAAQAVAAQQAIVSNSIGGAAAIPTITHTIPPQPMPSGATAGAVVAAQAAAAAAAAAVGIPIAAQTSPQQPLPIAVIPTQAQTIQPNNGPLASSGSIPPPVPIVPASSVQNQVPVSIPHQDTTTN